MEIGDIVVRKSYNKDITFKIIDIYNKEENLIYVLKGINLRILADASIEDLELAEEENSGQKDQVFNRKVKNSIQRILSDRTENIKMYRLNKPTHTVSKNSKEMTFGRPGRVLHIDGDPEYLEVCLKVYKQLRIDAIGKVIAEKEQPKFVVSLAKEVRPDIIVITGHDGIIKGTTNFMDLNNYRNSKYFVQSVIELRNYEPNYDDLVIFAGACQSCYEAILDVGANFASSPSRVLIHCLDPVFLCEKIAYASISKIISIQEVLESTITGIKGMGGLQTRGKYREGLPKSIYI